MTGKSCPRRDWREPGHQVPERRQSCSRDPGQSRPGHRRSPHPCPIPHGWRHDPKPHRAGEDQARYRLIAPCCPLPGYPHGERSPSADPGESAHLPGRSPGVPGAPAGKPSCSGENGKAGSPPPPGSPPPTVTRPGRAAAVRPGGAGQFPHEGAGGIEAPSPRKPAAPGSG